MVSMWGSLVPTQPSFRGENSASHFFWKKTWCRRKRQVANTIYLCSTFWLLQITTSQYPNIQHQYHREKWWEIPWDGDPSKINPINTPYILGIYWVDVEISNMNLWACGYLPWDVCGYFLTGSIWIPIMFYKIIIPPNRNFKTFHQTSPHPNPNIKTFKKNKSPHPNPNIKTLTKTNLHISCEFPCVFTPNYITSIGGSRGPAR